MTQAIQDLDVRPILRAGDEPFSVIMETVSRLEAGQALRLFATFEPIPLFGVLGRRGFAHAARQLDDGDWEVIFTPAGAQGDTTAPEATAPGEQGSDPAQWPDAARHLDNRDLDPPEPMVRTLAALEDMRPGEVLCALLCREPVFLLPELRKRGHAWQGAFDSDGTTYRLLVRVAHGKESAA